MTSDRQPVTPGRPLWPQPAGRGAVPQPQSRQQDYRAVVGLRFSTVRRIVRTRMVLLLVVAATIVVQVAVLLYVFLVIV